MQRKTIGWERLKIISRKLEISLNISCKDGHSEGQNGKDLTEAKEMKKKYTKKVLMTRITMMVWSFIQSQTSWSVKLSGPQDNPSGGDGIPAELFKITKMTLLKCYTQYVIFQKLSSGHKTGKCQFSFQCQRRAVAKNVQIIIQLCSFHMLLRLCSKPFQL